MMTQDSCESGYANKNNVCIPCKARTFSKGDLSELCETCPAGTYSLTVSAKCTNCLPGYISEEGANMCIPCLAGTSRNICN